MPPRRYYIRHDVACKAYASYKLRTATFNNQVEADNRLYDLWDRGICTGKNCRVRPDPIVMLVLDPYFEGGRA